METPEPSVANNLPTIIITSSRSVIRPHRPDLAPTLSPDLQQAGRLAGGHLLSLGFPHLAFFTSTSDHWSESVARGFFEVCAEASVTPHHVPAPVGNPSQRAEQLLAHLDALPLPCAILADHDRHAIELIAAARHLDLRIPEDVSIMGIGNLENLQERSTIPFTSVDLDLEKLGYLSVHQLEGLLRGRTTIGFTQVPPKGLVIRTSRSPIQPMFTGVHKALDIIRTSYTRNLNVPSIARECGMSVRNLHRLYRSVTGSTIGRDILHLRIEAAKRKLMMEPLALDPIAAAVGLGNSRNLCRLFRKHLGRTPGQWRSVHLHPSLTGAA